MLTFTARPTRQKTTDNQIWLLIYRLSGTDNVYNTATRCQAKSRLFNQWGKCRNIYPAASY